MTKKKVSQRRKKRKSGKRRSRWSSILHWPTWAVWSGGVLMLAAYAFVFYYFFVSPTSFRWKGIFGEPKFPAGYSIHGIDISHYQGEIDWDRLRNANIDGTPVRFIIIKATEGLSMLDNNFNDNFYHARENNFICGAYHFFVPSVAAKAQAEYFLKQVHLQAGDLPPVLDFEHKGTLSALEIKKAALTWLQTVEAAYNVKPIIYTNYDFKLRYLSDSVFNEYPYWIAHYYVDTLRYRGPWKFWQHTDAGRVDGIRGDVDLNIYNGSMYDLQKLTIGRTDEEELQLLDDEMEVE